MPVTIAILGSSYLPEGGETRVNSTTLSAQQNPSASALTNGGYVVAWTSFFQDGSGAGVYAQRFDAAGLASGPEVRVNSATASEQTNSAVTGLTGGGYAVTWMSLAQDGSSWGIYAQRYDSAGVLQGVETRVNTTTADAQFLPAIGSLADGGYVVTWQSRNQDGSNFGIYAQRYAASGAAAGGEFRVNATVADTQESSAVAGLKGGGFVVAWDSANQDGSGFGIYLQRYDAAGVRVGGETLVNTTTANQQRFPSIAALADGGFVVAWESGDGVDTDIYVQRYDALGTRVGVETRANEGLAGLQRFPSVGALADGGFVVSWDSANQDGSGYGVYSQRFDASGAPQGEARVNTFTANDQLSASVIGLSGGDYLVSWSSTNQDGTDSDIHAQRYGGGLDADEQVPLSLKGRIAVDNPGGGAGSLTVTLSADFGILTVTAGTSGAAVSGSGTSSVTLTGTLAQLQALLGSDPASVVDYLADADVPPASATLSVGVDDGTTQASDSDTILIAAINDAPVVTIDATHGTRLGGEILVNTATQGSQYEQQIAAQADGRFAIVWLDESDGVGGAGGDTIGGAIKLQLFEASGAPIGGEVLVNSAVWDTQERPLIAALDGGGYIVTWTDRSGGVGGAGGDSDGNAVKAQRFDSDGHRMGGEILVNQATVNDQEPEAVIGLSGGGFAIVWRDASQGVGGASADTSSFAVKVRVYHADGNPAGGEVLVNSATFNQQSGAQAAALPGIGFVVTWTDSSAGVGGAGGDTSFRAIKAQLFDTDGAPIGGEILVNTHTQFTQAEPKVTAFSHGGFVISWSDQSGTSPGDTSGNAVKAQVFDSDGHKIGGEIAVNTATAGSQERQQIAALGGGGFVIVWQDPSAGVGGASGDSSSLAVKAQVFDDDGNRIGGEILVNTATASFQYSPEVVALAGGGFAVAWNDGSQGAGGATGDSSQRAVKAQLFDASGARIGTEMLVNSATENWQSEPRLAALAGGGFVVAWDDESAGVGGATGDFEGHAVKAQLFGVTLDATEQVALDLKCRIHVADADAGMAVLTATVSVGYGVLNLSAGGSGASIQSGNGTGSVRLSGTLAQLNALLGSDSTSAITYTPNTDAPPASTILTVSVDDGGASGADPGLSGGAGTEAGAAAVTLLIGAVNDAPVLALPSSLSTIEGQLASFAGGVFIDPPPSVVSDADSDTLTVHITVADGALSTFNGGGATVTGAGTNDLTLSGTVAQVNLALYAAIYTPAVGVSGVRVVTVTASDGERTDTETINVNIADVGIEPAGQDVSRTTPTHVNLQLGVADFPFTDVEAQTLAGVLLTTLPGHGRIINTAGFDDPIDVTGDGVPDLFVSRSDYRQGDEISRADLDAGLVFYAPDADATGTDGFTFQVRDAGGPFGINLDQTPNSFAITLVDFSVAQNDAFTTDEATPIGVGLSLFGDNGSGADLDAHGLAVTAVNGTGPVGSGILLASGALLIVHADGTFNYDPNGAFDETPSPGSGASNTVASDSFSYTLAGGGTATVTIAIGGVDSNDELIGPAGPGSLAGGIGDDVYLVLDPQSLVLEDSGAGFDYVFVRGDYALAAGSEVEVLAPHIPSGTDPLTLVGNELANRIAGNAGSNSLYGGGGADTLQGLGGDDFYVVDDGDDVVDERAGEGFDYVFVTGAHTLAAGSEVEVLAAYCPSSTDALLLRGNELANRIAGNAGSNSLYGGGGADTMQGLGGDDYYVVDGEDDMVFEKAGEGLDYVFTTASYTLRAGSYVEVLAAYVPTDTAALDLTGNELSNRLAGNAGANVLDGGGGSDLLFGGGGADAFRFDTALGGGNVDAIADFTGAEDVIQLDDAVFAGLALGALDADAFVTGTSAQDAEDRIIYDPATGFLYFDADGNGAGAAVYFAAVQGTPALSAVDFTVI